MKTKINEQFLLVIITVLVVFVVIGATALFGGNKLKNNKSTGVVPNSQMEAKPQGKIFSGETLKFADRDYTLFHIEPINNGLAMYYSADELGIDAKSKLIINQYGNKLTAKALADGIIQDVDNSNSLVSQSTMIQSFNTPDSKGRSSYYVVMRDVNLMATTSIRMHVIKVFEDNKSTYSLIFQNDFEVSPGVDEEKVSDQWIIDNVTHYGKALDDLDITKNVDFYNLNIDLSSQLSVSNKFKNLKWSNKKIKEESLLVDIDIDYPVFIGGKEVVGLNKTIKERVEGTLAKDRAEMKEIFDEGVYSLDDKGNKVYDIEDRWFCRDTKEFASDCITSLFVDYEVFPVINDIVSVKLKFSDFTGGGNGNHNYFQTIIYDLKSGQELDKQDLFCNQSQDDKLMEIAKVDIFRQIQGSLEWIDSGTASSSADHRGIILGEYGLTIYFQPYTVAAGVYDILDVFIPYSDLVGDICLPGAVTQDNFIPLSKGTYWLYRVTGEEQGKQATDGKEDPTITTDKQVKIEVLKYIKRDANLQATLLTGFPGVYEGKSTLIAVADKGYYLVQGEEAFNRISNSKDDLTDIYFEDHLILPFPLAINKKFGCMDDSMDRKDNYYCYWVESIKPADAKLYPNKKQYQISFHTVPDVTNSYYIDGVGVTGFDYHHNGTLLEEKWELVKYFIAR